MSAPDDRSGGPPDGSQVPAAGQPRGRSAGARDDTPPPPSVARRTENAASPGLAARLGGPAAEVLQAALSGMTEAHRAAVLAALAAVTRGDAATVRTLPWGVGFVRFRGRPVQHPLVCSGKGCRCAARAARAALTAAWPAQPAGSTIAPIIAPPSAGSADPEPQRRPEQANETLSLTLTLPGGGAGDAPPVRKPGQRRCVAAALTPVQSATPEDSSDDEDWKLDVVPALERGFVPLRQLRRASAPVSVLAGSRSYGAWVSYQVNKLALNANKPLFVALAVLFWDITMENPMPYAVGAQPATRAAEGDNWRFGVLPNRADDVAYPTVAVIIMPGAPGVGKTTTIECVALERSVCATA